MTTVLGFTLNAYWFWSIVKVVGVLGIFTVGAILLGYVFLMKMMAHMQSRLGPMESGGFHGWLAQGEVLDSGCHRALRSDRRGLCARG